MCGLPSLFLFNPLQGFQDSRLLRAKHCVPLAHDLPVSQYSAEQDHLQDDGYPLQQAMLWLGQSRPSPIIQQALMNMSARMTMPQLPTAPPQKRADEDSSDKRDQEEPHHGVAPACERTNVTH